jgi:hypothetical protein
MTRKEAHPAQTCHIADVRRQRSEEREKRVVGSE